MLSKRRFNLLIVLFGVLGISLFSLVIISSIFDLSVQANAGNSALAINRASSSLENKSKIVTPTKVVSVPKAAPVAAKLATGLPVRLVIPKIKVDALIESVGLTSAGAMGVPKKPSNVGWYNLGSRPGDNGVAVIAGHFGRWKNGQGSVFDNLSQLISGDKLTVENDKGEISHFVVRAIRTYDAASEAYDVFGSTDSASHLNLITCEGTWDSLAKSFSKRLVVFADKVIE